MGSGTDVTAGEPGECEWKCFDDFYTCAYNATEQSGSEQMERRIRETGSIIVRDREARTPSKQKAVILREPLLPGACERSSSSVDYLKWCDR